MSAENADAGEESVVEIGQLYRNGDILLEVIGEPYTNEMTGMDYTEVRILEAKGFSDVSGGESTAKYPLVVLRQQFTLE
jgi:hypothetical protein